MWWTINGHLFPDVPMFVVREGDVVRMRISNHSGEAHPMHLHGHHAVVLARDGRSATGSPWWTDSLTVAERKVRVDLPQRVRAARGCADAVPVVQTVPRTAHARAASSTLPSGCTGSRPSSSSRNRSRCDCGNDSR
jgi:hypothetical protein